ncbi:MAG: bifunctional folylpolyglutamate synthase/dihydrofolate synthase, partial [Thermodesulfobacteriota bacterium]
MQNEIAYLNSLGLYKIKPGLQRILKILETFGDPHKNYINIIIGGTNGKGSVAATIASVLEAQGFKVGLYTSPHLLRVSERIKINNLEISSQDLIRFISEIKRMSSKYLLEDLSYFEFLTTIAFLYFSENKVDYVVLEVGMGGRLDATNVINPIVSVITNVFVDHTQFLGNEVSKIA